MVIRHNMQAIDSQNKLNIADKSLASSTEKLSTGYRVNRAADDAAALSISEKMRKQIRGLSRSVDNCNDGVSYVKVADGALEEVTDMLQRINVLSVKAANGTNSDTDRQYIDDEVQQLKKEIDRIFATTKFNDKKIWESDDKISGIHKDVFEEIDNIKIGENVTNIEIRSAVKFSRNSISTTLTEKNKTLVPQSNYNLKATENGINISWTAYNGKTYYLYNQNDITQTIQDKLDNGTGVLLGSSVDWPATLEGQHSFNLKDYIDLTQYDEFTGLDFRYTYNVDRLSTFDQVISSINSRSTIYSSVSVSTGGKVYDSTGVNELSGIKVSSSSITYKALLAMGRNFDLSGNENSYIEARKTGSAYSNVVYNPANISSSDTGKWKFAFNTASATGTQTAQKISNLTATSTSVTYVGSTKDPESQGHWYTYKYKSGNNIRTSTSGLVSHSVTGAGMEAITEAMRGPGGNYLATIDSTVSPNIRQTITYGSLEDDATSLYGGTIYVNFDLTSDGAFKDADGQTNAANTKVGSITLSIDVGQNDTLGTIRNRLASIGAVDLYSSGTKSITTNTYSADSTQTVTDRQITPIYDEKSVTKVAELPIFEFADVDISIHAGAESDRNNKIKIAYECLNIEKLGLKKSNTLTVESSEELIDAVSEALRIVSSQRSYFGAIQNRIESTIDNLNNVVENTTSAESKLRDTDYAEEMVRHSMLDILNKASMTMLSQANQSNEFVKKLLE